MKLEGYSAHGDQSDLINWLFEDHRGQTKQALGNVVFLQHGEDMQRNGLANVLTSRAEEWELDMNIVKPGDSEQWFDLERGGEQIADQARRAELESEIQRLQAILTALEGASHRQQEGSLAP